MKRAVLFWAILGASGSVPAQDLAPETLLLARFKEHLTDRLAHLPEYTCIENIDRYHRSPPGKLGPLDRVQVEVLYSGADEWYGWPGAHTLAEKDPIQFIAGGMIGNGLFALFQNDLLNFATTYTYRGEEALEPGGPPLAKYDFRLPRLMSGQQITLPVGKGRVGLKGSVWIESHTLDLLRLTVEADEIPTYLPLAEMSARIDYAHTRIGASDILLAQNADLHMQEILGEENYDRFEFTHCSQFHAESAVRFAEAADERAAPADVRRPAPPAPPEEKIPALLAVTIQLDTPLSATDIVGKALMAHTAGNVRYKGKIAIPDGSRVRGRLRRLQRQDDTHFAVGLEFSEIEVGGAAVPFYGDILRMDRRGGIQQALTGHIYLAAYPGITRYAMETIKLPEIPGVASFFVPGKTLALPEGFWTVWRTRGVVH